MSISTRIQRTHPATWVLVSFLLTIVVGTVALKLPVATHAGSLSWLDALFTATSAVCVTGLVVVDTGSCFTVFGQVIILILIQIGGLGVMTVSIVMFRWLGRTISFRQRMIVQNLFSHTPRADIVRLVKHVVLFAAAVELLGVISFTVHWSRELPLTEAVWVAVFHSISAFCNAGFALFPDSMIRYRYDMFLNVTMCALIFIGGIGFPVLYELRQRWSRKGAMRTRLSVHSRAVLVTTAILIPAGAIGFGLLELDAMRATGSPLRAVALSVFQSVTARTAGFNTIDISSLNEATLALLIFLMFIGASPGSCGGGVKTTTLALLL